MGHILEVSMNTYYLSQRSTEFIIFFQPFEVATYLTSVQYQDTMVVDDNTIVPFW